MNNYILPFSIAATILFVILIFFIIFFILVHKRKRDKLKIEKHEAIFEEQERTMNQFSKEIHDNLGGFLNLAMMNIQVAKGHPLNEEQAEALGNAGSILMQVISEVHNISHCMNSNYIMHRGLYNVLSEQLKYISSSKNIYGEVEMSGEENTLSVNEQLFIYRIAQEAIQNTLKHSKATKLNIFLLYDPDTFVMTIADNGIGFDKKDESAMDGIGLITMKERAVLLDGILTIVTEPGSGCTVRLTIKMTKRPYDILLKSRQ